MLIKEEKWSVCKCCGRRDKIIQQEVYGCDCCKKEIDFNKDDTEYLDFAIFYHDSSNEHKRVCSWSCFAKLIKKLVKGRATDYFINTPYLNFDYKKRGLTVSDFLKILK